MQQYLKNYHMNTIYHFVQQLVWKSTTHVGCAWVRYPQPSTEIKELIKEEVKERVDDGTGDYKIGSLRKVKKRVDEAKKKVSDAVKEVKEKTNELKNKIGIGYDVVGVCRFSPPGNVDTEEAFTENVMPLKAFDVLFPEDN